ncbi:MAG TPA: hypothetical protein VGN16_21365 [Acidobacteriaceae bacterium]|jgi:hypothetical protein
MIENADLGIPGISKTYDASITNNGRGPALVTRCDFVDDGSSPGEQLAFAIQRWDNESGEWREVLGASRKTFCHPYPLGMSQTHLNRKWLWPGQSLSIGEEATAARDEIKIGDKVRFVLFTGEPGDYSSSMPTEAFVIDQAQTDDIAYRIRH